MDAEDVLWANQVGRQLGARLDEQRSGEAELSV